MLYIPLTLPSPSLTSSTARAVLYSCSRCTMGRHFLHFTIFAALQKLVNYIFYPFFPNVFSHFGSYLLL